MSLAMRAFHHCINRTVKHAVSVTNAKNSDVCSQGPRGNMATLLVTYGKLNSIQNKIFPLAESRLLDSSRIILLNFCVVLRIFCVLCIFVLFYVLIVL